MGILDQIAGQVLGASGKQNPMMDAVMSLLTNQESGGLSGLIQQLGSKGLGDIINSWVSTGKNLPISAQQVKQGLGGRTIAEFASKAGISSEDAVSELTRLLPQVIDRLTPDGKIPQGDLASRGMDLLKGLFR